MDSPRIDFANPFFLFEVSEVCATCTKLLITGRSVSLDTPIITTSNINLSQVLESHFQFKPAENGPNNVCSECFSKTFHFFEVYQQCKKSLALFNNYVDYHKKFTSLGEIELSISDSDSNSASGEDQHKETLTTGPKEIFTTDNEINIIDVDEFMQLDEVELSISDSDSNSASGNDQHKETLTTGPKEIFTTDNKINIIDENEFMQLDEVENYENSISCNSTSNECTKMKLRPRQSNILTDKCTYCDAVYGKYCSLRAHTYIHKRKFVCSYCDKAMPHSTALKIHECAHTGERPFSCTECNKRFGPKHNLTRHLLTHTTKPFRCEICQKAFNAKSRLSRHMKIHTDTNISEVNASMKV